MGSQEEPRVKTVATDKAPPTGGTGGRWAVCTSLHSQLPLESPHTWLTFSAVAPENSGTGPKVLRTRFIPSLYLSQ